MIRLFTICLLTITGALTAIATQPNFVLLISDDQGWDGLSCQMHPDLAESKHAVIETPNIAKLASEGMRFSTAYSPAPVCSPTRISLQTGKSPAQCGWTKAAPVMAASSGFKLVSPKSRRSIHEDETTIAQVLKTAGYRTAHFGKWHLGRQDPSAFGYDESDGPTGNADAMPFKDPNPVDIFGMGERAAKFMETSSKAGTPFFLQMAYHALHYPDNATQANLDKYTKILGEGAREVGRAAMSEDLDTGVGQLLAKIDALGLRENTYVIYMSDNGGGGRGILSGGKGDLWEGGIRIPFMVRGPGIEANSWCHQRIVGYDLFPTFCQLAGVKTALPAEIEGGSIVHLLGGKTAPVQRPRPDLVFHFPHYQGDHPHSAIFRDQYKLMFFYEDKQSKLYDISADISERQDLSTQKPEITSAMVQSLKTHLDAIGALYPTPNPQYDPENEPTLRDANAKGKKGKGGTKGKGMKGKGKGKA
ncbi:MAG: sulfatase [Verrucomicrobiota bacterium]